MSVLLVDIGNTRMKWVALDDLSDPIESVQAWNTHACEDELNALLGRLLASLSALSPLTAVYAVSVASNVWRQRWNHWMHLSQVPVHWLTSTAQCGRASNLYEDPASLGADRWAMAIATAHHYAGQPCVVVGAGTATTVDGIDAEGRFVGGCILPGRQLMLQALHQNTAQLPLAQAEPVMWPRTTPQAIVTGVQVAQVGAVQQFAARMQAQANRPVSVVLSGGDAQGLAQDLPGSEVKPFWVLEGVRVWASQV